MKSFIHSLFSKLLFHYLLSHCRRIGEGSPASVSVAHAIISIASEVRYFWPYEFMSDDMRWWSSSSSNERFKMNRNVSPFHSVVMKSGQGLFWNGGGTSRFFLCSRFLLTRWFTSAIYFQLHCIYARHSSRKPCERLYSKNLFSPPWIPLSCCQRLHRIPGTGRQWGTKPCSRVTPRCSLTSCPGRREGNT